jgi:threonine dehydratase
MVTLKDIGDAKKRIEPYIKVTPIVPIIDDVYLKLENHQPVVKGFKIRGAASSMTKVKRPSVMTAALGTHGFAVGHIGKQLRINTKCMMIQDPPPDAEIKMKTLVDEVLYGSKDFSSTEQLAIEYAEKHNMHFVHPYNDEDVIAGQGTIGLEILDQMKDIKFIYAPIGGGGLVSGIAIAIKAINPSIQVIGVQPESMHAMTSAIDKGSVTPVPVNPSQAEKLAVNLNPKTITFDIIHKYVDDFIIVSEEKIKEAMKNIYLKTGEIAEGAGAIAFAAAMLDDTKTGKKICIVSGGNITNDNFEKATGIKVG